MSSVDVFYKSYAKDFSLLKYSLKSLIKNVKNVNKVQIVFPSKDTKKFLSTFWDLDYKNFDIEWSTEIEYGNGYLFQQWCKMNAYEYSNADYILFADSDCIFNRQIDLKDYVKSGKPEILYTSWDKVGDAKCWREPIEKFMGEPVEWEFMRRNCLIYHRSTLENIAREYPNLKDQILSSGRFSEFNALGAWAFKNEREKYNFINTDNWQYEPPKAEQLWGWAEKNNPNEPHPFEYARSLKIINETLGLNLTEI